MYGQWLWSMGRCRTVGHVSAQAEAGPCHPGSETLVETGEAHAKTACHVHVRTVH